MFCISPAPCLVCPWPVCGVEGFLYAVPKDPLPLAEELQPGGGVPVARPQPQVIQLQPFHPLHQVPGKDGILNNCHQSHLRHLSTPPFLVYLLLDLFATRHYTWELMYIVQGGERKWGGNISN